MKEKGVYSRFEDNIWTVDLAEIASLSSFIHGVKYLLCMTDVFTKYAWIKPSKNKKPETVLRGFIGMVHESKHKTK